MANESRAVVPVAVVIATVGASAIVVALRSYTRIVIIKQFGYDDIGAVVALVSVPHSLEGPCCTMRMTD